jgi:hypothetical protein
MDIANFWLPLVGVGIFFACAASAWYSDRKVTGLWFGFVAVVILLLLATLQIQHAIQEAAPEQQLTPEAAELRVIAKAQTNSQRAWLSVSPYLRGDIKEGSPIEIDLVTENVGKEPATGVSTHSIVMMFDTPEQVNYAPEIWSPAFAQVIRLECDLAAPQKGRATTFAGSKPVIQTSWDQIQGITSLMAGKKILVIYGCVGYFTLGEPHYTWYCFYLTRDKRGQWSFGSAPIGNDTS